MGQAYKFQSENRRVSPGEAILVSISSVSKYPHAAWCPCKNYPVHSQKTPSAGIPSIVSLQCVEEVGWVHATRKAAFFKAINAVPFTSRYGNS